MSNLLKTFKLGKNDFYWQRHVMENCKILIPRHMQGQRLGECREWGGNYVISPAQKLTKHTWSGEKNKQTTGLLIQIQKALISIFSISFNKGILTIIFYYPTLIKVTTPLLSTRIAFPEQGKYNWTNSQHNCFLAFQQNSLFQPISQFLWLYYRPLNPGGGGEIYPKRSYSNDRPNCP